MKVAQAAIQRRQSSAVVPGQRREIGIGDARVATDGRQHRLVVGDVVPPLHMLRTSDEAPEQGSGFRSRRSEQTIAVASLMY